MAHVQNGSHEILYLFLVPHAFRTGSLRHSVACSQTFFQGTALNFGPAGTFYKDSYCLGNEEFKNDSSRFAIDYSLNNESLIYFSYAKI